MMEESNVIKSHTGQCHAQPSHTHSTAGQQRKTKDTLDTRHDTTVITSNLNIPTPCLCLLSSVQLVPALITHLPRSSSHLPFPCSPPCLASTSVVLSRCCPSARASRFHSFIRPSSPLCLNHPLSSDVVSPSLPESLHHPPSPV